jgi:hypothetical protein
MLRGAMLAMQFRAPSLRSFCHHLSWMHWIFNDEIRGVILALNSSDLFIFHVKPPAEVLAEVEGGGKVTKEMCAELVRKAVGVEEEFPIEIGSFELWTSGYAVTAKNYQVQRKINSEIITIIWLKGCYWTCIHSRRCSASLYTNWGLWNEYWYI